MGTDLFNRQTAEYVAWLEHNGVEMSSKWKISDLRSHGRGRGLSESPSLQAFCF
jgi:hypothetical protein